MAILIDEVHRMDFSDVAEPGMILPPVTPGEVLREEYMLPLELSARGLAGELGVPPNRVTEIINNERRISAETAILLGRRFATSARFWLNLQTGYDLAIAERAMEAAR